MVRNAICPCPESEQPVDPCQGRLILDATSAPRWKLSCNECNIVSTFLDTIKRMYRFFFSPSFFLLTESSDNIVSMANSIIIIMVE